MRLVVLLLLIAAPLLEIGLLIKVGQTLGFWWTLGIVVGTALAGVAVLMDKGFDAPLRMQEAMLRGEAPIATMLDTALVTIAGVLLIFPGLICDALGLLLLIPPLRRVCARFAVKTMFGIEGLNPGAPGTSDPRRGFPGGMGPGSMGGDGPRPHAPSSGTVIEGDFEVVEERTVDPNRRKPDGKEGNGVRG